ncbi:MULTISPECIES: hypothetical protein [Alcanivoracaceae]|uniref:hypothetical protein n=1 Tax=Alcanivoracaceae TaxID=224372 RepID=UPI000A079C8B|nr:hypothetical protein [Alcanivorax hongdengensis]
MTFRSDSPSRRSRLLNVAATAWLLFISAAVVINHVSLSRLNEDMQSNTLKPQTTLLEHRLGELNQQVEDALDRPDPVAPADLDAIRRTVEIQLSAMEQAISEQPPVPDLAPLESRLNQFEARLQELRQQPPPATRSTRRSAPTKPTVPDPPFQALSIELRAGERFLSIAPNGHQSLADARVIRPGESLNGWLLESLTGDSATFRVNGQTRRLSVP